MHTNPDSRAEILSTETPRLFQAAVSRASTLLRAGHVVALPTETVYGLAANAWDAAAVSRIFEIKGRPAHNPIIVHVADLALARRCCCKWPPLAARLAEAFWPGPLTLVLPRSTEIPDVVTAGGDTVGIRWPSHPFIQAVIRECGFPLAAPSANLSNRVSPTNPRHVFQQLGHKIPLIVDGGQCQVGIESTVLDLSTEVACVLRPGMIHRAALLAVAGDLAAAGAGEQHLKSPGLLPKHYAPRARLVLLTWSDEGDLRAQAARFGVPFSQTHLIVHTHIPSARDFGSVNVVPHDPEAYARAIYAQLHECDDAGAQLILVESPPQTDEWRALTDRLNRAANP